MFAITMPIALLGPLEDDPALGLDNSSINSILALGTLARAFGKFVNGVLVDKIGVRPFLCVALLLASAACVVFASSSGAGSLGVAVATLNYCCSGAWLTGCKVIERRFRREDSGLCFSVLATCSRLGSVLTRLCLGLVLLLLPWRHIAYGAAAVMLASWFLVVQVLLKGDTVREKDADGKPKLQVEPTTPRMAKSGTPKFLKTGQRTGKVEAAEVPTLCQVLSNRGLQLHCIIITGATCLMSLENMCPLLLKDLANLTNAEVSIHAAIFPAGVLLGVLTLPHLHARITSHTGKLLFELGLQSVALAAGGFLTLLVSLPAKTVRVEFLLSCLVCIALGLSFNYYIKPGMHTLEFGESCATASSMMDTVGYFATVAFQFSTSALFRNGGFFQELGGPWVHIAAALVGWVLVMNVGTVALFLERYPGSPPKWRDLQEQFRGRALRIGLLLLGGSSFLFLVVPVLPQKETPMPLSNR